jgi:hypothetical protein
MRSQPGSSQRHKRRESGLRTLRFRDICCLLVVAVFAARVAAGLVVLDGFAVADRVCESEPPADELEPDEDGDVLEFACLSGSLMHLVGLPSRRVAFSRSTRTASLWCGPSPARGPPC